MARYIDPETEQTRFMPIDVNELIDESHPARRMLAIVRELDLSRFEDGYQNDDAGRPALPPDRILALMFYWLLKGRLSMRELSQEIPLRADLIYLSGGLGVEHSTFSRFRERHRDLFRELLTDSVFLGVEEGLVDFDTICIDGTRIKANANRRDIGGEEELGRRYDHLKQRCAKLDERIDRETDRGREAEADRLREKRRAAGRTLEKIKAGRERLKADPALKRVHLNDPDADWQKDRTGMMVGYNAQVAVDHSSGMILHSEVHTHAGDTRFGKPVIEACEEVKTKVAQRRRKRRDRRKKQTQRSKQEKRGSKTKVARSGKTNGGGKSSDGDSKYVLDAGYSGERNLEQLAGYDVYIPDNQLARELGGKTKPEDRDASREILNFKYDRRSDSYRCPAGIILKYSGTTELRDTPYRAYATERCGRCVMQARCVGAGRTRQQFKVPARLFPALPDKSLGAINPRTGKRNYINNSIPGPLTTAMRKKLRSKKGRVIYGRRFASSEGVNGVIKSARNGWKFLRTRLRRVENEWLERCISFNLGKLLNA